NNTDDGQQQVTVVNWREVRFGTVLFNPTLAESEVNDGNNQAHYAQCECYAPAIPVSQPWCCQHGEERTDVDGHIVHGKCTVQTRIIFRIAGRKQGGWVSFKQAVTHSDCCHTHIDNTDIVPGPC